jgi:hypothetical protein
VLINAELSQFRVEEGRKAERRIVNLAAALREHGATTSSIVLIDVSIGGFKAETTEPVEEGSEVWLKLPGFEAKRSRVVWNKDNVIGCEFDCPIHQSELDVIVTPVPRRIPKGVFGTQR